MVQVGDHPDNGMNDSLTYRPHLDLRLVGQDMLSDSRGDLFESIYRPRHPTPASSSSMALHPRLLTRLYINAHHGLSMAPITEKFDHVENMCIGRQIGKLCRECDVLDRCEHDTQTTPGHTGSSVPRVAYSMGGTVSPYLVTRPPAWDLFLRPSMGT